MGDCLSVGCYKIVVFVGKVNIARLEAPKNRLDKRKSFSGTAMIDKNLIEDIST
jgi:hypothetical protein